MDEVSSELVQVSVGLLQGSILRALLFLLFVNDIPAAVQECYINQYVDDTTINSSDTDLIMLNEGVKTSIKWQTGLTPVD